MFLAIAHPKIGKTLIVAYDVKVETALQPQTGEELQGNRSDEARSDVNAWEVWSKGQTAFFDIKVLDSKAQLLQNKIVRKYCKRILKAKQGLFNPLVFLITGGPRRECSMFIIKIGQLVSRKHNKGLCVVAYSIRCKLSYALFWSCLL